MIDASFHVTNSAKEREFKIQKLNISLRDHDDRPAARQGYHIYTNILNFQ